MLPIDPLMPSERGDSSDRGGREPHDVSQHWAQPKALAKRSESRVPRLRGGLTIIAATVVTAAGCGGESALLEPSPVSTAVADAGARPDQTPDEPGADEPSANQDLAPGITQGAYPQAPYGTTEGAVIQNLELFGWQDPTSASFDVAQATTVRLSDYYNPSSAAGQGTEYIMLNAVAAWCGVCRTEYQTLETEQTYQQFASRGLEMVGVLFEDNNGDPSTYQDLSNWTRSYSVGFPFVNDPAFKTGVYFDKSATPMNMIIDARSMKIVLVMTGYNPLIYDQIDKLLTERGR